MQGKKVNSLPTGAFIAPRGVRVCNKIDLDTKYIIKLN